MRLYGKQGALKTPCAMPILSNRLSPRLHLPAPLRGPILLLSVTGPARAQAALPDAPAPRPTLVARASFEGAPAPAPQQTFPPESPRSAGRLLPGLQPTYVPLPRPCSAQFCSQLAPPHMCCQPGGTEDFGTYLDQNANHVYTPGNLRRSRGAALPTLSTCSRSAALRCLPSPPTRTHPTAPDSTAGRRSVA